MAFQDYPGSIFDSSAESHAREALLQVEASTRPHGALRYQCPITGSYVLVTDETTLHWLTRPQARLRCVDCGELHGIACDPVESVVAVKN